MTHRISERTDAGKDQRIEPTGDRTRNNLVRFGADGLKGFCDTPQIT
jgi:hypothetical protein